MIAEHCFETGVLVRSSGDALVLSPPLVPTEGDIGRIVDTIAAAVRKVG